MNTETPIRLTQTVQKGGCAAKVAATELRKILAQVRFPASPSAVLVDGSDFDDAAIYQISPEQALVQTLDFFTPIVDTAKIFGQIACANALSDVYAMGGTPLTAMAILAFPLATLPPQIATEILQGACDILSEAGVPLVGGHSIDDDTIKFGLSVTGTVHPQQVWANSGARDGDVLILTKALGTGTLTAALKRAEVSEIDIEAGLKSMTQLNRITDLLTQQQRSQIHAATDVTGFGLLGHALHIAKASQKSLRLETLKLPVLPLADRCLRDGFLTKAHRSNRTYVQDSVDWGEADEVRQLLTLDPQTSGGLLLSVHADAASPILTALKARFSSAAIVGRVTHLGPHSLVLN